MIRVIIIDTETATEVQILNFYSTRLQLFLNFIDTDYQATESSHICNLWADMAMDADQFDMFQAAD